MKALSFILLCGLIAGCSAERQDPLDTVPYVDLQKYMGTWYEIASFPNWFQQDCTGTTANYSLNSDHTVTVINKCFKSNLTGKEITANGTAYVPDPTTNSKLKVSFFGPFYGDYWIIELGANYDYAVVGHPNRKYLWILSRIPQMDIGLYNQIVNRLKIKKFDVTRLQKTVQPPLGRAVSN